ncbi:Autophagy protein 5 [Bienertia sinuspersici]
MSLKNVPKTIISLLALLSLTLTITQSLAQTQCQRFQTVSALLESYEIPGGIFPNNVQSFSCDTLPNPGNPVSLVIRLQNACAVTREAVGVTNTVRCQQQISGVLSRRLLTNIKGVTVSLIASSPPFGPLSLGLTVNEVRVVQPVAAKFVQFYDTAGIASPLFPIALIPSQPPACVAQAQTRPGPGPGMMRRTANRVMAAYDDLSYYILLD